MGRNKITKEDKRRQIHIYLNTAEKEIIEEMAKEKDLGLSQFIRYTLKKESQDYLKDKWENETLKSEYDQENDEKEIGE